MTHYTFIVNPISGRGAGARAIPEIERQALVNELDYDLKVTTRPVEASELARQAARESQVIVAVGGDGTANEVLNGLMGIMEAGQEAPVMGLLAVGRGNDFAFGLGIPAGLDAGFDALLHGDLCKVDVGRVSGGLFPQGHYFGNGVGVGFDAVVGFEAAKITWLSGLPNYLVAAFKTISVFDHAPLVEIDVDGQCFQTPALMVSVMNGRRMGGGFMMAPEAHSDDGLFDLCIAGQVSRMGIVRLIPRFMQGTQRGHPAVRFERGRRVRITALEGSLPAHADGETICTEGQSLSIELLPGVLPVRSLCKTGQESP